LADGSKTTALEGDLVEHAIPSKPLDILYLALVPVPGYEVKRFQQPPHRTIFEPSTAM
jgi:hypothetical protein